MTCQKCSGFMVQEETDQVCVNCGTRHYAQVEVAPVPAGWKRKPLARYSNRVRP